MGSWNRQNFGDLPKNKRVVVRAGKLVYIGVLADDPVKTGADTRDVKFIRLIHGNGETRFKKDEISEVGRQAVYRK